MYAVMILVTLAIGTTGWSLVRQLAASPRTVTAASLASGQEKSVVSGFWTLTSSAVSDSVGNGRVTCRPISPATPATARAAAASTSHAVRKARSSSVFAKADHAKSVGCRPNWCGFPAGPQPGGSSRDTGYPAQIADVGG